MFVTRAGHLLRPEFVAKLDKTPPTFRNSIMGRAATTGQPEQVVDVEADATYALKGVVLAEG